MKAFFSILLCLIQLALQAQPKLSVEVSRSMAPGEDRFTLQYLVEGAKQVSQFVPPSFGAVELLQGPDQTQGYTLVGGELVPYVSISYVVRPKGRERVRLDAATATADGQLLHSRKVEILPLSSMEPKDAAAMVPDVDDYVLRKGESAAARTKGNLFVKLTLSRAHCYVGEPLVAEYKLYTRLNSESRVTKRPSFNGFSVYDMMPPESGYAVQERFQGKVYNVYILRKVLLYPLQEGRFPLESLEVENNVSFVRAEALAGKPLADILGSFGAGNAPDGSVVKEVVTVSNPPQVVEVRPLPADSKPAGFNGAVGKFSIEAHLKDSSIRVGDVQYLDLVVSGKGNLPMLARPQVSWPQGVETYEDSIREDYNHFRDPDDWTKTFTIPFSPRQAGKLVIPAVTLVYFNPDSGRYESSVTAPLELDVAAGTNPRRPTVAPVAAKGGQTDRIWLLLPVVLILGILILFFRQRWASRAGQVVEQVPVASSQPVVTTPVLPKAVLLLDGARAKAVEGDAAGFYGEAERALREWLWQGHELPPTARKDEIRRALGWAGKDEGTTEQLIRFLQDCELARFSPLTDEGRLGQDLERLEHIAFSLVGGGDADQSVNL